MQKVKISAVSYLNTLPFIYGIENSPFLKDKYILEKDIPAVCADKLINGKVDLGLIPVAEINRVSNARIISNFCIGAVGKVKTVLLLSDVPLNQIQKIYLDYQSRTSVKLVRILAEYYWKISPEFIRSSPGFENNINNETAGLIIGDRTFNLNKNYRFKFDLSEEWTKYTSLPFVFAAWVANKDLPAEFNRSFNKSCKFGIENINIAITEYFKNNKSSGIDIENYLLNYISYSLDNEKRKGMEKFLNFL